MNELTIETFSKKFNWEYTKIPKMKDWFILLDKEKGKCIATIKNFKGNKEDNEFVYFELGLHQELYNMSVLADTICVCKWDCGTIGVIKRTEFAGDLSYSEKKNIYIKIPSNSIKTIINGTKE